MSNPPVIPAPSVALALPVIPVPSVALAPPVIPAKAGIQSADQARGVAYPLMVSLPNHPAKHATSPGVGAVREPPLHPAASIVLRRPEP